MKIHHASSIRPELKNYLRMKKLISFTVIALTFIVFFNSCGSDEKDFVSVNPAFRQYISAFTAGVISKKSTITIELAKDNPNYTDDGKSIEESLFDFQPSIEGEAYWIDQHTIEFRPKEPLASDQNYICEFKLNELIEGLPDDLEAFRFSFRTIKQAFSLHFDTYKPYKNTDLTNNKISGTLTVNDVAIDEDVKKILTATQNRQPLNITWEASSDGLLYPFQIEKVVRTNSAGEVLVNWNGKSIGVDSKGDTQLEIPALSDFKVMNVTVIQQPEQSIAIDFSDPLKENQNLDGLITLNDNNTLRFTIQDNQIKVYLPVRQKGTKKIYLEKGIQNILGYKFNKRKELEVTFEDLKPAVRLLGEGVIIPSTDKGLIFPFQAVNLNAVDVKIIQIYENNVLQFLQVNRLNEHSQLKRVGRIVHKETIKLTSTKPIDFGKWNTFSIDLSKLINVQPGAIYRVEIGFRKAYSVYHCDDSEEEETTESSDDQWNADETENEETDWDYYDDYEDYYYDDYYYYDYENRDNPCHKAYYRKNRFVSRNVLASDLGIIAKSGTNNDFTIVVSNIKSTEPMPGVTVEFYNFQNQLMGAVKTGRDGFAKMKFDHKPFLIIAKYGNQRGYLRVDDGASLSLSNFDVSGQVIQKGIKGYIYGERGVWRPGDSLFLMFILEDPDKLLPENHPIVFELYNPSGQLSQHIVKNQGVNGFYNFATATDKESPTGNWTAKIKVGGAIFTKQLKIETIKPNRLKIKLDFGSNRITSLNRNLFGQLQVAWLSGATASNLDANITATMTPMMTSFEKYPDFVFDDPAANFYSEEITVFDGNIDENGNANVNLDLKVNNAPGMVKAHFVTRAFEQGGDFSIDRFSIPYSPYESYVGIRVPKGDERGIILTDTNQTVDIVTVDENGKPIAVQGLQADLYKVEWRWWWSSGSDDLASYVNDSYHQPIVSKTVNTNSQGRGKFTFRVDYPEWGRYLVRVYNPQSGHATGKTVYIDWPGWAGRDQRKNPEGATMLVFNTDKEKYRVGENIKVNFPSSAGSRALVSIESGSKIIDAYWVTTNKNETSFLFKATKAMTPNIFIHITLVQPYQTTANDLPIRLYGVIPVSVEDPQTKLHPVIEMPNVLVPEKKVTINIKEKDGKPMTYTIAVVDEGLLDLTRFSTPNPWQSFYAREALGVKTWDLYDYVLGAYGGKIAQLFTIGGDGELQGGKAKKANRFKPMVKFMGPFTLKAGKHQSHSFMMPRYIGSVRTMVIAGYGDAYGNTEKTTPVRKPLMVLPTFPRVVSPGETVKLPVTIFAMEKKVKNVTVTVKTNGYFSGEKQKSVSFTKIGEEVVNFDLQVAKRIGIGKIQVIAKSGSETATYDFEIDVRVPNPPVTDYYEKILQPGQSWNKDFVPVGIAGTNSANLEVSNIPPIDFGRRLKYLLQYPYGCVEQTTSAAFPQLYIETVMAVDSKTKTKTNANIIAAIKRLKLFQLPNGGLGYWPDSKYADDWGTSYAGHFLLEAEKKGFQMPIGFKKKWIKYQKEATRNWSPGSKGDRYYYEHNDLLQAYRLYTLALAKVPVLGEMNRLREQTNLSIQARWRLAAAYVLAGQPEMAKKITGNLTTTIKPYAEMSYSYGSDDRDRAMILETMSLMNQRNKAIPIMKQVSKALSSNRWMSTQTTAYCLIAMTQFAGTNSFSNVLNFTYNIGKGNINASTKLPISQINIPVKGVEQGKIAVKNTGKGIIYVKLSLNGIPEAGDETTASENLTMKVRYLTMNGKEINVSKIEQGTDFMAEVTVYNPGLLGSYREMALTQIFPSGWEIQNVRMDDFENVHEADIPTYRDIRDDRVFSFFDIYQNKTKTYRVLLNAAYQGKFYLPAVSCEAMYDHQIRARVPGQWVEVVAKE